MKTAPHLVVGLTACAALAAGFVLATEDRALFEPCQAQMVVCADDAPSGAPRVSFPKEAAYAVPQGVSPATRETKH